MQTISPEQLNEGVVFLDVLRGFATLLLRHFYFDPLEWLWRSGTYGQWQPSKKELVL